MMENLPSEELHEMKDRIRWIRKQQHLSQVEFAKRLRVSQSVISLIESGHASVSVDILKKLSDEFELSCDWLIYGKDRYVKLTTDNNFIPLIDADAEAGFAEDDDQNAKNHTELYKVPGFEKGDYKIFEVSGDSMVPSLHPQDKIICERVKNANSLIEGSLYVLITDGQILVKRVQHEKDNRGYLTLISDNRHYQDEKVAFKEVRELWAVKAKITSSFIDQSFVQNERMDSLERDLGRIKEQVSMLVQKAAGQFALDSQKHSESNNRKSGVSEFVHKNH